MEPWQYDSLDNRIAGLERVVRRLLRYLREHEPSPAAPTLSGSFTTLGDSMNATLTATLPTTRQDNTALAPTAIASITYQKTSLMGSPPAPGPLQTLQTNKASGTPVQLQPADLTFTDAAAAPGDDYTCFVTDTLGHIGKASNDQVAPASASPPVAPTLTAVFA
jgi:hypothetical protein